MKFTIPCATYVRLSAVCRWVPDRWPQPYIRSLYIERRDNRLIAVVTNSKIAAVELLSPSDAGPNENCFVAFDATLLQQANTEIPFASSIDFDVMPELQFGAARTMFGYSYPGNVAVFPTDAKIETVHWRDWFPEKLPSANYGQLQIKAEILQALAAAAPSGEIVFHHFVDTRVPSVVRDNVEKNWYGVFMPSFEDGKQLPKINLPTW